jgi:MFS family permease
VRNLREYAVVTGTYWVFTVTDGALRMLVLLHLHELGYAPLEIASLFLLYELFGILTNAVGGWIGARFGLRSTLFAGLTLQILGFAILAVSASNLTLVTVMVAQALSGTAKDLTKMSAKSYVKRVVPDGDEHGLMRWVALLTGSKNTLKGAGFFVGGALLTVLGFRGATAAMALALSVSLVASAALLPTVQARATKQVRFTDLLSRDPRVNWLSASRLFLFGARDLWFVLALPIYLSGVLGWAHAEVGAFLAVWVMGYGVVQASAPAFATGRGSKDRHPADARTLGLWTLALIVPLGGILAAFTAGIPPTPTLMIGLAAFGVVFAANSAVHSYLIVSYAEAGDVALRVGFYYMANAAGRLVGTVLSGTLFQAAGQGVEGLLACIGASLGFVLVSALFCAPLRSAEARWARHEDAVGAGAPS